MTLKLQKNLSRKKKYTVTLIGLGKAGYGNLKNKPSKTSHYYKIKKTRQFKIKYLFDLDFKNLKKIQNYGSEKKINSYKELSNINKTDITIISVPVEKNLEVISKLNKFKILSDFIILEKPVSYNLINFKKIQKILLNKIVMINYQRSWNKFYDSVFKGKKNLSIYHIYNNGFLNNCSHMIALLIKYFGKWEKYTCLFKNNLDDKDPNYSLILYFKNNNKCILDGVKNSNLNIFETIIHNRNKIIELKSGAMSYNERRPKKYTQIEDYFLLSEKNDKIEKIDDNPYFEVAKLIEKFTNNKLKDLKMDNFPSLPMSRDIISLAENLRNDKKI